MCCGGRGAGRGYWCFACHSCWTADHTYSPREDGAFLLSERFPMLRGAHQRHQSFAWSRRWVCHVPIAIRSNALRLPPRSCYPRLPDANLATTANPRTAAVNDGRGVRGSECSVRLQRWRCYRPRRRGAWVRERERRKKAGRLSAGALGKYQGGDRGELSYIYELRKITPLYPFRDCATDVNLHLYTLISQIR